MKSITRPKTEIMVDYMIENYYGNLKEYRRLGCDECIQIKIMNLKCSTCTTFTACSTCSTCSILFHLKSENQYNQRRHFFCFIMTTTKTMFHNFPVFHKHGPCVPRALSHHSNVKTKEKLEHWAKNHTKGYTKLSPDEEVSRSVL